MAPTVGVKGQEIEFNAIARKIMEANGVAIDDLYAEVLPHLAEYQRKSNVHFSEEGYGFLARKVTQSIQDVLQNRPSSGPGANRMRPPSRADGRFCS